MVVGGAGDDGETLASAEIFDPATGAWSQAAAMDEPRRAHTATLLPDGRVLVVGGTRDGTTPLASAEQFVPDENRWASGGAIKDARWGHSALLMENGQALIAGGYGFNALRSVEIYTPAGGGWYTGDTLARRAPSESGEYPA